MLQLYTKPSAVTKARSRRWEHSYGLFLQQKGAFAVRVPSLGDMRKEKHLS